MMSSIFLAILMLATIGSQEEPGLPEEIAGKELGELLEDWPDQYVKWIITKSEREVYKSLATDKERLQFIEFFWTRRDPDPETPVNEFRNEYLERFAFVQNYLSAGKPGWATDRGRLYLILGPPHGLQRNPVGRWGGERPSEIWTYNNLDIPGFPASIDFEFVDFNGTGDFELVQDIDTAAPIWNQFGTVNNALDAIAQRRMAIGEVDPRTGRDRFRDVDGTRVVMREFELQQRVLDVLQTPERQLPPLTTAIESRASFGNLSVTATGGAVRSEGETARVPVQLTVPYRDLGYRSEVTRRLYELDYVIMVAKESGEEAVRLEDQLTVSVDREGQEGLSALRLSIEEVLEVPPGEYRVVAYIRDRNQNRIGNVDFPLQVPAGEGESIELSSVFLAGEILKGDLDESRPFQFGSVRVIPAGQPVFTKNDTLKLYVEAYDAAETEEGQKQLRVDFFVMRDGRLYMGVPASYLRPFAEPVGVTGEIPLRKCEPGEYVIRVRVTDEITGEKAESETGFVVLSTSQPGP